MARGECGTYAGAMAHNADRTPMCAACKRAHADYIAGLRFRRGNQRDPRRCKACGSVFVREHKCQGVTRG